MIDINPEKMKPVPNRDDHFCFGCGPKNPHGLNMTFESDGETVLSRLRVPEHLCGWDRLVHGGVITTILDEIMSWTAISILKSLILTRKISVEFKKPVYVGEDLQAAGRIESCERGKKAEMKGFLYNSGGVLCARASGEFALITPKMAVRLGIMDEPSISAFLPVAGIDKE